MSSCEVCKSEFSCGRLAMALKVAEAALAQDGGRQLRRSYDSLKRYLEGIGWNYPGSTGSSGPCMLAGRDHEIQELTSSLIAALDSEHTHSPKSGEALPSLANEEYSLD